MHFRYPSSLREWFDKGTGSKEPVLKFQNRFQNQVYQEPFSNFSEYWARSQIRLAFRWIVNALYNLSHFVTACTVVQAVVKATSQSNGKGQILTPWGSKTPERISMKLGIYNRVAGMPTHANPFGAATTWVVWANTWKNTCFGFLGVPFFSFLLYSSARAEPAHVDRFWRSIRHTTCFHPRMCLLGSRSCCSPFWG